MHIYKRVLALVAVVLLAILLAIGAHQGVQWSAQQSTSIDSTR